MTPNRVLVFDIESSPIQAYVWGLKDQNISLNQIIKDWQVMAWGAKWLDEPPNSIMYQDTRKQSEFVLLKGIWKLLDEADIVITQNGKSFDSKRLNARFIHYSMNPPSPYRHIDTYLVVKQAADFTSNKLEYLTDKLCTKYKKTSHSKFPGMSLWKECLKGNVKAWDEMKEYNIYDVLSTEELYNAIKAWGPKNMPCVYPQPSCAACGWGVANKGIRGRVQRIKCKNKSCGRWSSIALTAGKK